MDLQSEPSGLVRAVKRVYERDSYMKEVIALSKVSDVSPILSPLRN